MINFLAGTVDISPLSENQMGCGPTKLMYKETNGTLEANYLIISGINGDILLISFDLLYVGKYLTEKLKNRLSKYFDPEKIILVASHTHYAPMTDFEKPRFGDVNKNYVDEILEKIYEAITQVMNLAKDPGEIKFIQYQTHLIKSRRCRRLIGLKNRRIVFKDVVLGPSDQYTKLMGNIITLGDSEQLRAVIWIYPCHPTSLPRTDKFDAHFIGETRELFRQKYGNTIPIIFMQGFSGDLRPPSHVTHTHKLIDLIRKSIFGSWFQNFQEADYSEWTNRIFEEVKKALSDMNLFEGKNTQVSSKHHAKEINHFAISEADTTKFIDFYLIDFSEFALIGISAEVVYEYQLYLDKLLINKPIIGFGCVEDVFGYLPTTKMIEEGGYESKDSLEFFGIASLEKNIENETRSQIKNLLCL